MTSTLARQTVFDDAVDPFVPLIRQICEDVWNFSEIGVHEYRSAEYLRRILQEQGFAIVSTGTSGHPTAFIAEWGNGRGGPKIGFLPEYDALPGLGNEAVPYRAPRKDGNPHGHGCGHNLLGAGCIGAALALKAVMEREDLAGTIRVYGCAAEEIEGAKVYMARDGHFADLDAAFHWHPNQQASVMSARFAANNGLKVEFFGRPAHAGSAPWNGRSAVHAAELFAHGLNLMREHILPTARLHYVYERGGDAPNVVPDYARLGLKVRDANRAEVVKMTEWIKQIAQGAALATQTRSNVVVFYGVSALLPNTPLAKLMQKHLERIGPPTFTREEQEFARELQRNFGTEPQGMSAEVLPLPEIEPTMGGSSDVAEVSWNTPTMGCTMPCEPIGIPVHTWAATAYHGTSAGVKAAVQAAKVLAATAGDVLLNEEIRREARADWERRTGGRPYVSPLPPEMKRPLAVSPELLGNPAATG